MMPDHLNETPQQKQKWLILKKILEERSRQDTKFGASPRNMKPEVWLTVLTEELGEVSRAIIEGDSAGYETELIQVAAVAIAALEDYYLGCPSQQLQDVCKPITYLHQ
jgi:NTP pyrophosphatase (non-canonical NTP hydrolase)